LADHRDPIAARHSAEDAGARDVHAGESEGDQRQEAQRDGDAELRAEELAEELNHEKTAGPSSVAAGTKGPGDDAFRPRRIRTGALSRMRRARNSARPFLRMGDKPVLTSPARRTSGIRPNPATGAAISFEIHRIPMAQRRSEEHTSELQSRENLVCRLLL